MANVPPSHSAYDISTKATASPRAIEGQVFTRVTAALGRANQAKEKNYKDFVEALSRNLELWTIVAANVAGDNNELPAALRSQLFYLAEFTSVTTRKILNRDSDANAEALIEINKNIIRGLRGQETQH